MIREEICTYEVCELAKEKGFDVPTDFCYEQNGCLVRCGSIAAPSQSLLQRWLREERNIDIAIVPLYTKGYSYIVYNIHCRDNRVVNTNVGYDTYELALEDALKYALENLV